MLAALPFVVIGFHADNASRRDAPVSEYVNRTVAEMLNKLHVPDFYEVAGAPLQRQRPRRCPPCRPGLRNASVVRKWLCSRSRIRIVNRRESNGETAGVAS